jgi:hypothetical protein
LLDLLDCVGGLRGVEDNAGAELRVRRGRERSDDGKYGDKRSIGLNGMLLSRAPA